MRGVVFTGNSTLEFATFADPEPGTGEEVVEMKASGMCGSGLKFYRTPPGAAFAALGLKDRGLIIAGHEPAGVVAAVGKVVGSFRVGDRVMVYDYDGCHTCDSCRGDHVQMCSEGATVDGVSDNGGHADSMKVPESTLIHLSDELSFATDAAISCGTGTAFAALVRMDVNARDTLAVMGSYPFSNVGQADCTRSMKRSIKACRVSGGVGDRDAHQVRYSWPGCIKP
jgi:(R,R)-butanediol dehydrogenase / meso-butanediol dehydrogenase / diacetyl reductase